MRNHWSLVASVAHVLIGLPSVEADLIRTVNGERLTATVVAASTTSVTVEDRAGERRVIPVEEILEVLYDGEPQELKSARDLLIRGRPADAIEELGKLEADVGLELEPPIVEERAFVAAAARGEAALVGQGNIQDAGKLAIEFLRGYPESPHTFRMLELVGDLLAASGNAAKAEEYYLRMTAGPPVMKVRAAMARGRTLLSQGDFSGAVTAFDEALAIETDDVASRDQKRMARVGKARCLVGLGRGEEAVSAINDVLDGADPEDESLMGAVYAALGDAQRSMGRIPDAIVSYLTVDLVYNKNPEVHAEALSRLAELWDQSGQKERAREARDALQKNYPEGTRFRPGS